VFSEPTRRTPDPTPAARSPDAAPSKAEVERAWRKPPPPLSLHARRQWAARSLAEPENEQDELSEGERQQVKSAVRQLRGN
jgi:hypothetical protein